MNDKKSAEEWLKTAIERHKRHMDGKEPTTGDKGEMSQMLMMAEMRYALRSIQRGSEIAATEWYVENSGPM